MPLFVDVADFLQEIPTEEGRRFINPEFRRSVSANNLEDRYCPVIIAMCISTVLCVGYRYHIRVWCVTAHDHSLPIALFVV